MRVILELEEFRGKDRALRVFFISYAETFYRTKE